MSMLKIIVTAVLLMSTVPVGANAQTQRAADGWYTAETAPEVGPKPSCGKKPNKRESFVAMWYLKDGQYTVCQWDSQGEKPKPKSSFWSGFSQCVWQPNQYLYDQCLRYGPSYTGTPTQGYLGGNVRPYVGRTMCSPTGNYMPCNGPGDLRCQMVPC